MKRILDSRYWILDTGYRRLVKSVANATASAQYPESRVQNRLGGTTSDDEKLHRETIEKLGRRR